MSMERFLKKLGYLEGRSKKKFKDIFYFLGNTSDYDEYALYLYKELKINKFFVNQNASKKYIDLNLNEKFVSKFKKDYAFDYEMLKWAGEGEREFKKIHRDFGRVVLEMKRKRKLLLVFTQIIYEPVFTLRLISKKIKERSRMYAYLLNLVKLKLQLDRR